MHAQTEFPLPHRVLSVIIREEWLSEKANSPARFLTAQVRPTYDWANLPEAERVSPQHNASPHIRKTGSLWPGPLRARRYTTVSSDRHRKDWSWFVNVPATSSRTTSIDGPSHSSWSWEWQMGAARLQRSSAMTMRWAVTAQRRAQRLPSPRSWTLPLTFGCF